MNVSLGRVVSALIVAGGWLLAGMRLMLDIIGYATLPEDAVVARSRFAGLLDIIVEAPWWAVYGFAFVATLFSDVGFVARSDNLTS